MSDTFWIMIIIIALLDHVLTWDQAVFHAHFVIWFSLLSHIFSSLLYSLWTSFNMDDIWILIWWLSASKDLAVRINVRVRWLWSLIWSMNLICLSSRVFFQSWIINVFIIKIFKGTEFGNGVGPKLWFWYLKLFYRRNMLSEPSLWIYISLQIPPNFMVLLSVLIIWFLGPPNINLLIWWTFLILINVLIKFNLLPL